MIEALIFYAFAGVMIFASLLVISLPNPVGSAISLVLTLFLAAAFYAKLGADFVAAIQVLVYAGAIMVLFLFVIMLLNLAPEQLKEPKITPSEIAVLLLAILGFVFVSFFMLTGQPVMPIEESINTNNAVDAVSSTRVLGRSLFGNYIWPFELASLLILLAIVASVVIAKKDKGGSENA